MADCESSLRAKYDCSWVPEKYLELILTPAYFPYENWLTSQLNDIVNSGKVKGPRGIDIGSGPTVHRIAILGRVCDEVMACDILPSNLEFVKKWLDIDEGSDVIGRSLHSVVRLEGHNDFSAGEKELTSRLREKIKSVVQCDVTSAQSVQDLLQHGGPFDCAHSSGVLECICKNYESFVAALRNIYSILKPGASFILSGYITSHHHFDDDVTFEPDMATRGLADAGFKLDSMKVHTLDPSELQAYTAVSAVFFSVSYK